MKDTYWLSAGRRAGDYPSHGPNGGKWLLFVPVSKVDEVWSKIESATEAGRLGNSSKVATAKPSQLARNSDTRVICVYTYDFNDESDVMRVRDELRKMGITEVINYKADEDTFAGKYASRGDRRISKYRA